jgi:hypothetical protein
VPYRPIVRRPESPPLSCAAPSPPSPRMPITFRRSAAVPTPRLGKKAQRPLPPRSTEPLRGRGRPARVFFLLLLLLLCRSSVRFCARGSFGGRMDLPGASHGPDRALRQCIGCGASIDGRPAVITYRRRCVGCYVRYVHYVHVLAALGSGCCAWSASVAVTSATARARRNGDMQNGSAVERLVSQQPPRSRSLTTTSRELQTRHRRCQRKSRPCCAGFPKARRGSSVLWGPGRVLGGRTSSVKT